MGFKKEKYRCCERFELKPHRIVVFLTGIQVIRALWEIWVCVDNKWPLSACAATCAYKGYARSLNIHWWIYYMLTVLGFINSCAGLSIMCIGKDRFVAACYQQQQQKMEQERQFLDNGNNNNNDTVTAAEVTATAMSNNMDSETISGCVHMWEKSVVWAAIGSIATLLLNIVFAYMLYRVKSQQYIFSAASIHPQQQQNKTFSPAHHHHSTLSSNQRQHQPTDEDGFQIIELK
ncbi:hypothetical protein BDA99DRAFT_558461 [Phascolomyces articulosus]|uniref:Uncharacterized protein n=1 Tax=Phascolomyces articulosus TaxID=60185 RepID=A0AAD5KEU1_9FUNG|nr:hypothetical protein BDA99DRAFT_558461 [Phascolomyces articulosus]